VLNAQLPLGLAVSHLNVLLDCMRALPPAPALHLAGVILGIF